MLDSAYKKVGGVCAGLARYLGISRFFVRLAALMSLINLSDADLSLSDQIF